ncbi:MAG: GNAT family N-acetyltransferase [Clostridia bacterium]|nr:GNAT family N-acetyltransferase [Clostridia bacterium]
MLTLRLMDEAQTALLYEQHMRRDFPPSELKGLSAILTMQQKGVYDVIGAYMDEEMVAYALVYRQQSGGLLLLDYLAVVPHLRCQGIGKALMAQLRGYYASAYEAMMIECERPKAAPDEQEARSRIRFYEAAGALLTSVRIWLFDVEYSILVFPCGEAIPQRSDWAEQMLSLYRQMLPGELYARNVRLIRK